MEKGFLQLKSLKLVLFLVFGMTMFLNQLSASHLVGSDISYQSTSTAQVYKVTLKLYRDCSGIPLCPGCTNVIPTGNVTGCSVASSGWSTQIVGASPGCVGVNFGSFTLAAVSAQSGFDIIQTCNSVNTICTNCNTRTAGTFSPGIEVFTYEGNVDLSGIPSTCCNIILGANSCCRNSALTTIVPGNYQTVCTVNRCINPNSAPTFSNDAVALVCPGVDFVYNLGAIDPDGDSLSYVFGQSLQGIGSYVSYIPPYSAAYPFPYLGAPNQNATYPGGLRIDPMTGDILFRPQGVFVSNLVIEVTQWRLVSGVRVNVGVTRRDVQFQTQLCLSNKVPIIKTYRNGLLQVGSNYNIGFGQQFCLDLVAEDQQDLTTSPQILADTTDLKWNNPGLYNPLMSNATFTRNYILSNRAISGPKADSFKFCWTPPLSAVRLQPYNFTVTGSDRFCPIKAFATRGINITVLLSKNISIDDTNKKIFCGNKTQYLNLSYKVNLANLQLGNVFTVELSDTSGNFITSNVIGTKTDSSSIGIIPITIPSGLLLNKNYKLRIKCSSDTSIYSMPFNISVINGFNTPTISLNRDSFCKGSIALFSVLPNDSNLNIKWLRNNLIIDGATNDSLFADSSLIYKAVVSNSACSDTSNAKYLTVFQKPIVGFTTNKLNICAYDNNFNFIDSTTVLNGTYSRKWYLGNGDTSTAANPSKTYNTSGLFAIKLVATSNRGCKDSIIKNLTVNPKPTVGFTTNNPIQCINGNNFLFNDTSSISSGTYSRKWNLGTGINDTTLLSNPSKVYSTVNTYSIKLVATSNYGCKDSITKNITLNPKPIVGFSINNLNQCLINNNFLFNDTSSISSGNNAKRLWKLSSNDTSSNLSFNKVFTIAGAYSVKLIEESNNGCKDSLTKNISVTQLIANTTSVSNTICSANGNGAATMLVINGTAPYRFLWSPNANNQTSQTATGLNKDSYQVTATDANNCNITKSVTVSNIPNVNTQVPITNIAMLDQNSVANYSQYYNYDLPISINPNSNNLKNYADAGKYFRFKIQTKNNKINGQSIVNGFCKVRSNSPYLTITDSIVALNNIAYNGKLWSADEFEVYINPTTPKGSNLYLDLVVEESANQFSTGCLSIPITPLNYSPNTSLTIDDDNIPDSHGNNNDTCELGEAIEFYPWLNNVSDKKAQYVKGMLLNNNNFAGINIWNNIKGVNDTVLNNTWWNLTFGKPTSIDTGSIESKPAMDFVFDYNNGAPKNNFNLNLAVSAGFRLLSDTTLSLIQWSLPYTFKSESGTADALQVNPQSLVYSSAAASKKVGVTSNRSWTASVNQSWLTLNTYSGSGNDSLIITLQANTGNTRRSALVTITAGLITKTVSISQDSSIIDILNIDQDTMYSIAVLNQKILRVISNRSWTANSNQSWVNLNKVNGFGNDSIYITISNNSSFTKRSAIVTITAGLLVKKLVIIQDSSIKIDSFSINKNFINSPYFLNTNKVTINSNRTWLVTSNQSWVTLNKTAGLGNDSIIITIAANTGLSRTASLTFTAGLIIKTLTINQDSFTIADVLLLDKDSIKTSFGASLNTVLVSSNRSWIVSSNQGWCGVSTVTGSGNGNFNVINLINNTGLNRNALVTVTAGSITKNVYIGQSSTVNINNPIFNNQQITLYPNPNNGNFTIQLKNTADKNGTITIVDMLGRIVYESPYKLNNNEDIISISQLHLQAGTYNIIIGNKDGVTLRKSFVVVGE